MTYWDRVRVPVERHLEGENRTKAPLGLNVNKASLTLTHMWCRFRNVCGAKVSKEGEPGPTSNKKKSKEPITKAVGATIITATWGDRTNTETKRHCTVERQGNEAGIVITGGLESSFG